MRAPKGGPLQRLAGAPISWGVCEVPGWGVMLPRERVLSEMRQLGLGATEMGALGYLGDDPATIMAVLGGYSLGCVGGFVPISLHDPAGLAQARADAQAAGELLAGSGGTYFVTAIVVDQAWSPPFELEPAQWDAVVSGLEQVDQICAELGLVQVVHPHVGTLVERPEHIHEIMRRSGVSWCLDTGHFAIGGTDPVDFAAECADRVQLVHLKDVDLSLAPAVRRHSLSLLEATRQGLFRPLGCGDVDVASVVHRLEQGGYNGWYVLEQDTTISKEKAAQVEPLVDVQASIDYLRRSGAPEATT